MPSYRVTVSYADMAGNGFVESKDCTAPYPALAIERVCYDLVDEKVITGSMNELQARVDDGTNSLTFVVVVERSPTFDVYRHEDRPTKFDDETEESDEDEEW
jgi:hypothetical protein